MGFNLPPTKNLGIPACLLIFVRLRFIRAIGCIAFGLSFDDMSKYPLTLCLSTLVRRTPCISGNFIGDNTQGTRIVSLPIVQVTEHDLLL